MKRLTTLLSALLLLTASSLLANQPGTHDVTFKTGGGPDGLVRAIARQKDGKVLIGGDFTSVHASPRKGICRLLSTGLVDLTFNPGTGADGTVRAIVVQSDGKIIIGGQFTRYNGIACDGLIRLNTNGSTDTSYQGYVEGEVTALTLQADGMLLVGGMFDEAGGASRYSIARLLSTGHADTSFTSSFNAQAPVNALAVQSDGKIYVAGAFGVYGATIVHSLVRLQANGSLDGSFTAPSLSLGSYNALAVQKDGKVLVGGSQTYSSESVRRPLARLNADGTLDSGFNGAAVFDSSVSALGLQTDGKILVGGNFQQFGSTMAGGFARLKTDGTLDSAHLAGTGTDGTIHALHVHTDNKTLIGGDFYSYNSTGRARLARIKADGLVDTTFTTTAGANNDVWVTAVQSDGKVLIAGDFTRYNGSPLNRVARLKTDGTVDTTFIIGSGANNRVSAVALQPDGKILLGGEFTSFNGSPHRGITRLNTNGSVDTSFDPGSGVNGLLYTVLVQPDGKILLGGTFSDYDGTTKSCITRINSDGSQDVSFTSTGVTGVGEVLALALTPNGRIYVGGNFNDMSQTPIDNFVRLTATGQYDSSFNTVPGTDGTVYAIGVLPDGDVMIGGSFNTYRSSTRNSLARINSDGSTDAGFDPGSGPDGEVFCLSTQPDRKVVIGGGFTQYRAGQRNGIARVNADGTLDSSFDPGEGLGDDGVLSLTPQADGKLVIGGFFSRYNTATAGSVARIFQNFVHLATTFTGITTATTQDASSLFGKVSVSLTSTGSFSGSVTLGTEKVVLTGAFNRDGLALITAVRKDKSLLYVNLALRRGSNGGAVVEGQLQDSLGRIADLFARATYFSSTKLPAVHFSGRHNVALKNPNLAVGTLPPMGHGYLACTVATSGTVTLAGKAPDGTTLVGSVALGQDGVALLHLPLYTSKGFLNGSISIDSTDIRRECSGNLLWSRPISTTYPAGFSVLLTAEGQLYVPAVTGQPSIVGSATITITGGHLPIANPGLGTASVTFSTTNVATVSSSTINSLKVTISRTTGIFTGSFIPAGATKAVTLQGILYGENAALGYTLVNIGGVILPASVLIEEITI